MAAFPIDYFDDLNLQDYLEEDFLPSQNLFFMEQQQPPNSDQTPQHSSSSGTNATVFRRADKIQFFVRTMSESKTLVLNGNPQDKIHSIHQKLQLLTGIPVSEQRLIYGRKQLQSDQTLSECMITNDSGLHLVGRMRSCWHPEAWQVINNLVSMICRLCNGEQDADTDFVKLELMEFLSMIPPNEINHASVSDHLHIFTSSCVPQALVMLYMSPYKHNKECATESVQELMASIRFMLPQTVSSQFVPVVLLLCKMLQRAAGYDDSLYKFCRSSLGDLVKDAKNFNHGGVVDNDDNKVVIELQDMFPFAAEVASKLSRGLVSSVESVSDFRFLRDDVTDFVAFLKPLKAAVRYHLVSPPILPSIAKFNEEINKIKFVYMLFDGMLKTLVGCFEKMEGLVIEKKENGGWDQFLVILKELHDVSKLFQGGERCFWKSLKDFTRSLCHLIVRYAKRGEDYGWILDQKDAIDFESRRHLVMLLFPVVVIDEYDDIHEMLIDRSQLLAESFVYVAREDPERLQRGLFLEFKDEEATGPGVLREWFFLLSQEIFNPKTGLFVACPNDPRRSFPNPASKVDPLHLEYFNFAGRVIALALMNNIQVGIVFDRSFFLQLAGKNVSLEDIKDADPFLYSSCRQILDMDPLAVDQDALGLTFVWDIDELGSMKVAELCPGGKNMIVNSRNRKAYVDLLIHHCFVASVAEQISHFARGFSDIIGEEKNMKTFFNSLALEDFDRMLHGSESDISVVDWKAHTDYKGYLETDPQIYWFWKLVENLTAKQRKILLFFWISMKYLPVEGFGGLTSRLYIYKSNESIDHLPSSHTCFYQICLPAYPSMAMMKNRLDVITQDHVGYSFGTS